LRATLATLSALALLCFVHWLPRFFWEAATANPYGGGELRHWLFDFQAYGLTPPAALSWLSVHGDNIHDPFTGGRSFGGSNPWSVMSAIVIGLLCWGLAAYWLWRWNCFRFRAVLDRMPRRLENAFDYSRRVEPAHARV